MKTHYVVRRAPKPKHHVTYDEAHSWDVTMLLKSHRIIVTTNLLYEHGEDYVYVEATDAQTYDMLDAFGVPHITRDEILVLQDQEVFNEAEKIKTTTAKVEVRRKNLNRGLLTVSKTKTDGPFLGSTTTWNVQR